MERTLESREKAGETLLPVEDIRDVGQADGLELLDRKLAVACRERGPLRAALARIAFHLVSVRAWERISYARLSDYAVECLGLSARSVRSLARVGGRLGHLPLVEDALVSGTLGWTKVRLLASLPLGEDEARWTEYAKRVTAHQLSKAVRAVDRGSVEAGAAGDAHAKSRVFEVRCSPEVRWKWLGARGAASRAAGRMLHVAEAAELIAAEVLSALPIDEQADKEAACEDAETWSSRESEPVEDAAAPERDGTVSPGRGGSSNADRGTRPRWRGDGVLRPLLAGLQQADAFELHDRFRRALAMEQRLDARIGPLLSLIWRSWVHTALGYATREAYARERLGMDATRARTLVRLERAAVLSESFARAYRTGALSWVKGDLLVPLVTCDSLGWFVKDWVAWAGRVTVRRLREDVEQALALSETEPMSFQRSGGLPPEARGERVIRNAETGTGAHDSATDREIGAPQTGREGARDGEAGREIGTSQRRGEGGSHDRASDREIGAPQREREGVRDRAAARDAGPPRSDREGAQGGAAGRETGAPRTDGEGGARPRAADREIGALQREREGVRDRPADREIGPPQTDREIRAPQRRREGHPAEADPGSGAAGGAADESCWVRFFGPADVVQLFRAVLCTVRRRVERDTGKLPTAGEALGAMLDHALSCWGAANGKAGKVAARHRVFARDGWRCAVPGCTSMQNLHDHHVRFRSAGGSDALENRVTLCAFHHLRGVHAALLRCVGRAPDGLTWQMGIRPGVTPLLAYRSGDLRVPATAR